MDMLSIIFVPNRDVVSQDYFTYANRGRNAWQRYLATISVGLVFAVVAASLVSILLAVSKLLPADVVQQFGQPSDPWLFFGTIAVLFAFICGGIAGAARLIQHKSPLDIIGCWRWSQFGCGLAVWISVQFLLAAIDFAIAPSGFHRGNHLSLALTVWVLGAVLVQTFAEEFVFRGLVTQGIFLMLRRPLPSACVSGLLFGAVHLTNGWPQAINAVWFGIVCAYLAIRTGGIALTCGIHLANNYFGAVGVVSAGDVFKGLPGLFVQNTPQLEWWDLALAILTMSMMPWALRMFRLLPDSTRS